MIMIKNCLWPWDNIKFTLFICLSLILSACAFHEQYPPDWSPLVRPSKDCFIITGKYNDYDSSMKKHSLGHWLTGIKLKSSDTNKTNYVQIEKGEDDALSVTVWYEKTKLAEKIYKKDEYTCSNEGMEISKGVEVLTEWVLGLSYDKVTLTKASDGSLVVIYETSGFGLFGALVPFAADGIQYYKYSQKK